MIVASGGRPRITKAPNEEKYLFDKGISFCATCDAAANTGKMDCNEIAREQALANPKMEFRWNTMAHAFEGGERLERVVLKNLKTGELDPVPVDTCFEFIGYEPNTEIFKGVLPMTKQGYVTTNEVMETTIPGVLACGDVRDKELKQVATAVGDGAIAGYMAERFIADTEMFENQIMQKDKVGLIYVYSAIDAPSRELLPMMQEIEKELDGAVKLSVLDLYKGKRLCDRLSCDVEPMTIFYTKNGEVVEMSTECARAKVLARLNALVA